MYSSGSKSYSPSISSNPPDIVASVTSKDVIDEYFLIKDGMKYRKDLDENLTKQKRNEEYLIKNTSQCSTSELDLLRDRIPGLKAQELKRNSIKKLYNAEAMKGTMCAIDSIFYTSPYDVGSSKLNDRIRLYIHNLRNVGDESLDGYALLSDFENVKDMFILKVARDPKDDTLLHELVIGLHGTNTLRKYIPNFAYVYGGFKCSPPLIDPVTKKVVTWCLNNDNPVNYVIYENISPAVSMEKYLETCTGQEFLQAYLQVLYSLRTAEIAISYSHYDLHTANVLIRTLDIPKFQLVYNTENGLEYLSTSMIATIIDY